MELTPRDVASRLHAEAMIAARHAWHQYYSRFHTTSQANAAASFVAQAMEELLIAIEEGIFSLDKGRYLTQALREVIEQQRRSSHDITPPAAPKKQQPDHEEGD